MFFGVIPILASLVVFLLYAYWRQREGLQNQTTPVSLVPETRRLAANEKTNNFYYNLRHDSDDPSSFFDKKYAYFYDADIKVDLSYFNNTSHLLYALSKLEKAPK
jgi:hypothetical protein